MVRVASSLVCLYHCGAGTRKTHERYIVVSIYCDAFEGIDGVARPDYLGLYRSVRPWFCRTQNALSRDKVAQEFRERILELIDQPGKCLRDQLDVLDFNSLETDDLSAVPHPGFHEALDDGNKQMLATDWELIDTAEKMKRCIQELTVSRYLITL